MARVNGRTTAGTSRQWGLLLAVIVSVLVVDQITKRVVVTTLALGESLVPIPALASFFRITHSANTGAAFGFLPQAGDFFMILALVVVAAMLFFYPRLAAQGWVMRLAVGLVCGGALGNALDRIEYGHVVDFIHYRLPGLVDNVSNLADHAIVFGVLLILYDNWRGETHAITPREAAEQQPE